MFRILLASALICTAFQARPQSPVTGNPAELPFSIELEDATRDELPGLHSFSFANWNGWWVVIGGRINGLHGFFPFTAFPDDGVNAKIWLINPETGEYYTASIDNLNIPFKEPLRATNPQYVQDGDVLYIAGGYGKKQSTGEFVTWPILTAVDLPKLTTAILAGNAPNNAFQQIELATMQVCGGEMEKLGDYFYLVGGHDFEGTYTQTPSPSYTQTYTSDIRKFKINRTATSLSISDYSTYHDENNLHRRDFSMGPVIRPDGSSALCLYGGVFRPDADLPYYNPVYIAENDIFDLDASYQQLFSQYTCPLMPLYDSLNGDMYTVFFAGLSANYWDTEAQQVKYDERVPFIRDITTFRRRADGQSLEYVMPQRFDELLGANMIFVPDEHISRYPNEVLRLNDLSGKTFAGYLFGGIKASIPNITPSVASNRMFRVYVITRTATASAEAALEPIKISPNPSSEGRNVQVEMEVPIRQVVICNADGHLAGALEQPDAAQLEAKLSTLTPGLYFIHIQEETGLRRVLKFLRF